MQNKLHEMLAHVFGKELGFTDAKAWALAASFPDLDAFVGLQSHQLLSIRTAKNRSVQFSIKERRLLFNFIRNGLIDPQLSVSENYTRSICRYFIHKQISMIQSLTIDDMHPNPFLIKALKLDTPESMIRLNVYDLSPKIRTES